MKKTVFDLSIKCWWLLGKFYFDENQKFWWSYWSDWPCWIFKRWFDQCVWRIRRIICSIIVTLFELCGSYKHTKNHENVSRLCQRICVFIFEKIKMKIKYFSKIMDFAMIENSFCELSRTNDNKKAIRICERLELQVSKKRIKEFNDILFKVWYGMNELIQWAFIYSNYKIYKIEKEYAKISKWSIKIKT